LLDHELLSPELVVADPIAVLALVRADLVNLSVIQLRGRVLGVGDSMVPGSARILLHYDGQRMCNHTADYGAPGDHPNRTSHALPHDATYTSIHATAHATTHTTAHTTTHATANPRRVGRSFQLCNRG